MDQALPVQENPNINEHKGSDALGLNEDGPSENTEDDGHDDNTEGKIALSGLAPPVDYNVLVVQNNGVVVGRRKGMGRVAISSCDKLWGKNPHHDGDNNGGDDQKTTDQQDHWLTPILIEEPAVICRSYDYLKYAETVLDLPPAIQVVSFAPTLRMLGSLGARFQLELTISSLGA